MALWSLGAEGSFNNNKITIETERKIEETNG